MGLSKNLRPLQDDSPVCRSGSRFRSSRLRQPRVLLCACLLGAALFLFGCYSFTASTLPAHIRTVNIHEVDNKTLDPVLGNTLRDSLVRLFRKNAGGVRLVNENADADFEVTLLSYTNKPENYNKSDQVETYRVTMKVNVRFYDNVVKRMIYEGQNLSADGVYDVLSNESEDRHGQPRAIEKLQDLIITNALAKW